MSSKNTDETPQSADAFVDRSVDAPPSGGRPSSLRIKVNADNTIAWESEEQKQRFALVATSDPDALEMIGSIIGDDDSPSGEIGGVSEGEALMVLNMFSSIEAVGFKYLLKIDPDIATHCARFTEEEQKNIPPVLAKVMDKHLTEKAKKYKEETALAIMLFMAMNRQAQTARHHQAKRNGQAEQVAPNGHADPKAARPV